MATRTMTPGIGGLPAEFQEGLDSAARQERIAQMLLSQSQRPVQGQRVGRFYVPPSPLQQGNQVLAQVLALKNADRAEATRTGVARRYEQAENSALDSMLQRALQGSYEPGDEGPVTTPPDFQGATTAGMSSKFPRVKSLAEALMKQRMDLFSAGAKAGTPESVVRGAQTGGDPMALKPDIDGTWIPETRQSPVPPLPGQPPRVLYGEWNSKTGEFRVLDKNDRPPANVSATASTGAIKLGDAEKEGLNFAANRLEKSEPIARAKAQGLRHIQEALAALDQGVKTGRTQNIQQWVRGVMTDLGISDAGPEAFDQLAARLQAVVLASTGGSLGNQISNADREFIMNANGSVLMEPTALRRALTIKAALDIADIEAHNSRVDAARSQYPALDPLMSTARVNWSYRPGSTDQMFQSVGRGGSTFDAVPAGKQLNVQDAVPEPKAQVPKAPKPPANAPLTPEEAAELEARRRRLFGSGK